MWPRQNGLAETRGELKSNGPTRVGELGRSWKATDRGWGLKIRRLLRCPASTYSQVFRRFLATICDNVVANLGASAREVKPALSTADIWTKTSLPPVSG
jgi:hypothetical protein